MNRFCLDKYPPPDAPASPLRRRQDVGVESFALYPPGFQNAAVCNDEVFSLLDVADALEVRRTRLYWATRNEQDAAMRSPFLDIARSKWHG